MHSQAEPGNEGDVGWDEHRESQHDTGITLPGEIEVSCWDSPLRGSSQPTRETLRRVNRLTEGG